MAKEKEPMDELNDLIRENTERQHARAERIAKLEKEKEKAEMVLAAAVKKCDAAKEKLDASEMIAAGTEKEQAALVVNMFAEALDAARNANVYSYDEIRARYDKFIRINAKAVSETNRAICVLLAQIEAIVNKAEKASADLDALFSGMNHGATNFAKIDAGALVYNMKTNINHTRQHFAGYWPSK